MFQIVSATVYKCNNPLKQICLYYHNISRGYLNEENPITQPRNALSRWALVQEETKYSLKPAVTEAQEKAIVG